MSYSKGIFWLEDCRIPFVDEGDLNSQYRAFTDGSSSHKGQAWNNHLGWEGSKGSANPTNQQGRFTPNLLVCDDMLNDGSITRQGQMKLHRMTGWGDSQKIIKDAVNYQGDKGTNSRYYDLDLWFDKMLEKL